MKNPCSKATQTILSQTKVNSAVDSTGVKDCAYTHRSLFPSNLWIAHFAPLDDMLSLTCLGATKCRHQLREWIVAHAIEKALS